MLYTFFKNVLLQEQGSKGENDGLYAGLEVDEGAEGNKVGQL